MPDDSPNTTERQDAFDELHYHDAINRMVTDGAPRPWRIEEPNKHYFCIVDATGNRICDFFPFAAKGGRGREMTLAIAEMILHRANFDG